MRGGKFLNNWRMAQLHAQESPDRVRELEQWGALFDRTEDGRILQRAFGGHTYKRLCHVGDRTGLEMIRTLQDRGVQMGFDVYMECAITRLLKDGDRVAGAFGYWREQGASSFSRRSPWSSPPAASAKPGQITSNSWEYTGDGMALAYDAGAELHGHGVCAVSSHGNGVAARRAGHSGDRSGARRGRHFAQQERASASWRRMIRKRMELSTRDLVARSIYTEVKEGRGTEHGGAFLDISHKPAEYVKRKLPSMYHQFKELADVDITKRPMEVGPTCHYMMGGIRVDAETAEKPLSQDFLPQEKQRRDCTARTASAATRFPILLVFGRRAGMAAAKHAKKISAPAVDNTQIEEAEREMLAPFERKDGESPYRLHRGVARNHAET